MVNQKVVLDGITLPPFAAAMQRIDKRVQAYIFHTSNSPYNSLDLIYY